MIRYFYLEVVMNFEEFKTLFKDNHKEIVSTIMGFLEIDDEELLNHMIQRTYIAFAGGYARRLYMVQNDIEMTPEDMEAYFTSDLDFFSISSSFQEKKPPSNDDDFFLSSSNRISCFVDEIDEFKLNIYTSKMQSNSISLEFKPLKNKLKSLDIPKYERSFAFYKGDQIMVSDFGKNNIFSIRKVHNVGKRIPHVQYVNVSKKKLVQSTESVQTKSEKMKYVQKMVSTFDLSQTKFFFEHMSDDVDKCVINSDYANTTNIYHCDISEQAINNVNQFSRILKYAQIGMQFKEEDIKKLMGDNVVNMNGNIIEGGYY